MTRAFAFAAFLAVAAASAASADVIRVPVDHAEVIRLPREAAAIVVGNPLIADVSAHDGRLLFITGKAFGATNMIVLDEDGATIYDAEIEVVGANTNRLTMQRGRVRETYRCAPRCESVPVVGDEATRFGELFDAARSVAQAANQDADSN